MNVRTRQVAAVCVAGVLFTAAIAVAQDAGVRPVATVRQIMEGLIVPMSDAVFQVADPPTSAEEWAAVERQAAMLAEGGNLLLLGQRPKDKALWAKEAQALIAQAGAAATAARERNFDKFSAAGEAVVETCVNCHAEYLGK